MRRKLGLFNRRQAATDPALNNQTNLIMLARFLDRDIWERTIHMDLSVTCTREHYSTVPGTDGDGPGFKDFVHGLSAPQSHATLKRKRVGLIEHQGPLHRP